jgi:hypothetical protein
MRPEHECTPLFDMKKDHEHARRSLALFAWTASQGLRKCCEYRTCNMLSAGRSLCPLTPHTTAHASQLLIRILLVFSAQCTYPCWPPSRVYDIWHLYPVCFSCVRSPIHFSLGHRHEKSAPICFPFSFIKPKSMHAPSVRPLQEKK